MSSPARRPDRRQLEMFVAVVNHGGFAGAARSLGVSPSAVSQGLRQLEAMVGSELFVRTVRPLTLTAAGAAAEAYARRSLQDLDAFVAAAAQEAGSIFGRLTICTIPTQSTHPVAQLVGTFRATHPRVRVDIMQPPTRSIADVSIVVRDGLADVGITEFPTAQHGLRAVEFAPQEFVAVLPPRTTYTGDTIDVATFLEHGLVIGPYFETSVAYAFLKRAYAQIDSCITIRTDHRESFPHLVAQGVGVTLVNRDNAASARELGCRIVEFSPRLRRRTGLVYPSSYLSPAAAAFVAQCRAAAV